MATKSREACYYSNKKLRGECAWWWLLFKKKANEEHTIKQEMCMQQYIHTIFHLTCARAMMDNKKQQNTLLSRREESKEKKIAQGKG